MIVLSLPLCIVIKTDAKPFDTRGGTPLFRTDPPFGDVGGHRRTHTDDRYDSRQTYVIPIAADSVIDDGLRRPSRNPRTIASQRARTACKRGTSGARVKHCYADEPNLKAFGEGFRAGFIHIKNGGNGCPPLLPPRKYWSSCCYRGCQGQAASVSWFNGFSQGVTQGLYDGVAGCNTIVTSRDLYGNQCEETIDITEMLEHVRENGSMSDPDWAQPGYGAPDEPPFEWTPQPLPQGAYDNLQEAEGIWDENLFQPSGSEDFGAPQLEPIEQLPTGVSDDDVSPALIEFLDPFETLE